MTIKTTQTQETTMSDTITIHHYTATWDDAMRPSAPDVGTEVLMPADSTPDARELDGFRRVLSRAGLTLEYEGIDEESGEEWYTVQRDWEQPEPQA